MLLRTANKNNYEPSVKKKENNLDKTRNSVCGCKCSKGMESKRIKIF